MDGTIARRPRYHQNNPISDWLEIYQMNRLAGGLNEEHLHYSIV